MVTSLGPWVTQDIGGKGGDEGSGDRVKVLDVVLFPRMGARYAQNDSDSRF